MSLFIGMGRQSHRSRQRAEGVVGPTATDRASERRAWWVLRPPIAPASGGRGIRTHDDVAAIAVFKTAALGHYASPPTLGEPRGIPNDGPKRMPRAHPCCVGSEAETKEC